MSIGIQGEEAVFDFQMGGFKIEKARRRYSGFCDAISQIPHLELSNSIKPLGDKGMGYVECPFCGTIPEEAKAALES